MPGGNKKGHTYLNKPVAERSTFSCRFVLVCVTFLLSPGIKVFNEIIPYLDCGGDY